MSIIKEQFSEFQFREGSVVDAESRRVQFLYYPGSRVDLSEAVLDKIEPGEPKFGERSDTYNPLRDVYKEIADGGTIEGGYVSAIREDDRFGIVFTIEWSRSEADWGVRGARREIVTDVPLTYIEKLVKPGVKTDASASSSIVVGDQITTPELATIRPLGTAVAIYAELDRNLTLYRVYTNEITSYWLKDIVVYT